MVSTSVAWACKINWEKLPHKVPGFADKARPQGLTVFNGNLVLSNHFKDARYRRPSELIFLHQESFKVLKKLSFPEGFAHVGGLGSDQQFIYASDFGQRDILQIDVASSFKNNTLVFKRALSLEIAGASGLSVRNDLLAVSFYALPHRSPYFRDRFLQFYDLSTSKRVHFKGEIFSSNFSQGLAFVEVKDKVFLVESINSFSSVLRYWLTGLDSASDIIRTYAVNVSAKTIRHMRDDVLPSTMVEDLAFDGERTLYTTDEQDFHFYRGAVQERCSN